MELRQAQERARAAEEVLQRKEWDWTKVVIFKLTLPHAWSLVMLRRPLLYRLAWRRRVR